MIRGVILLLLFVVPTACGAAEEPDKAKEPDETHELLFRVDPRHRDQALNVLRARLGDGEWGEVERSDGSHLRVTLRCAADAVPGHTRRLSRRAKLEFRALTTAKTSEMERRQREILGSDYAGPRERGYRWVEPREEGPPVLVIVPDDPERRFDGTDLDPAELGIERDSPPRSGWVIRFAMREDRKGEFRRYTASLKGRQLAIIVDGEVESAPTIQEELPGGGQISGGGSEGFSRDEAAELVKLLHAGPLPDSVKLVSGTEDPPGD